MSGNNAGRHKQARNKIAAAIIAAVAFVAASIYYNALIRLDSSRAARDFAGDLALPETQWSLAPSALAEVLSRLRAGGSAYLDALRADVPLVLLILASWLAVGALAHLEPAARRWARALIAVAVLGALADFTENMLLARAFELAPSADSLLLSAAAGATTAKWLCYAASSVLALLALFYTLGPPQAWGLALFLDVPYLVDSAARRLDLHTHQEFAYDAARQQLAAVPPPWWRRPAFWFFAVTAAFVGYGPTLDGLCTVVQSDGARLLFGVSGGVLLILVGAAVVALFQALDLRIGKRIRYQARRRASLLRERRRVVRLIMGASVLALLAPVVAANLALLWSSGRTLCEGAQYSGASAARLALTAAAIAVFAWRMQRSADTRTLLAWQGALLAIVAGVHWYVLATPQATEASALPYRHLWAALAPVLSITLAAAPWVAYACFRPPAWLQRWVPNAGVSNATRNRFCRLLKERELFDPNRADPVLTPARTLHALIHGVLDRPLQLLLLPALFALVAPADWLYAFVALGAAFSLLLLAWSSMSERWQQLPTLIARWFLRGLALPLSVFVLVIAVLRVGGVDYVSTILNAAPFGVVFGAIAMIYVYAWLIEYWLNRTAAVELLQVLGGDGRALALSFDVNQAPTGHLQVAGTRRHLLAHGIGRLLVLGTLTTKPEPAFNTSDLLGVFAQLAQPHGRKRLQELIRYTDLYFYLMNGLIVLVLLAFGGIYWKASANTEAVPVVTVRAHLSTPTQSARVDAGSKRGAAAAVVQPGSAETAAVPVALSDLAARLPASSENTRPALIVVGSGGGTRAALYTAHVLQGLHKLGADRDIVLLSGVSGGGVALTYFAANFDTLTADRDAALPAWQTFRTKVSSNFIQDVLEGAGEWRIFLNTALTSLLAESFERRLLGEQTFAGLTAAGAPPLLLNTTVVGHPLEESDLLLRTIQLPHASAPDCAAAAQPYNIMHGGRLVFTNLKNVGAFPQRQSPVPDTRLPYRIVQDPAVPLARAAALNANFPPAFQNARVLLQGETADPRCPDRSYFVTDGGVLENLSLVSALFALESALRDLSAVCARSGNADPRCARPLRPIHFVLAEASATGYDYAQDRGVSTALGGVKERMTGGLTNALIERIDAQVRALNARHGPATGLRFHYLPLPLAFRARGGFGTHWMHADRIELSDPRLQAPPRRVEQVIARLTNNAVALSRDELAQLWTALHDPSTQFCEHERFANLDAETVKRWVCGARHDPHRPRDTHVGAWQELVKELGPGR